MAERDNESVLTILDGPEGGAMFEQDDVPKHLRCVDCGLGRPVGGALHTAAECRDNLRTALAAARAELATLRAATLREAAGVCEEYEAELCRRDPRARVYAAGVGADENAVFTVRDRILALLGEGVGS